MQDVASSSAMQQIHFGRRMRCSDGEAGLLTQVVFDSASRRMAALGVRLGRWFGRSVYVSFETVVAVTEEGITLGITRADLAISSREVPTGALLDSKSVVETDNTSRTAARGTIHIIAVHPESGELAYLVAHHIRPGQDTFLRGEYVTQIEAGHVEVSLPEATWQTLPQYHPDSQLQQQVEESLYDLTLLHIDFKGMNIGVRSVTNTLVVNPKEEMLHAMSSAEDGQGEDLIPGKYIRHTK